ncbi:RhoGAP-domain-containing protein [Hesseltinella vesiculosa]|uniref:RhoGAP-domain-containing protein n=1 Tax=Hesseltinella vesiculosa TaxID=101127 RepID=A0A1X2GBV7_9FUNG|nr:RhoGAP-domain-containing protein [Hesseltinella vesiculosa]
MSTPQYNESVPVCSRCHLQLGEQLVRALGGTFHPECFTCLDCQAPVAAKFFPYEAPEGQTLPLCERDYFRRLDLLCGTCGDPLLASYIIALDKKYHTDHFMCSVCSTTFGPEDSYYEHEGHVYCHYHYSTQFAVMCAGCNMAILKQYVEIDRNNCVEHWHPECYMIHKFWNVKVQPIHAPDHQNASQLMEQQHDMENKIFRIWQVLSAYEESSAMCISEMLLHVSNGAYLEGICLSERFLVHVEALFTGIDDLAQLQLEHGLKEFNYTREAKMLCKKIINFFSLLSKSQDHDPKKPNMTQELLSLVTGLAHYLKTLIRIALSAALELERYSTKPVPRLLAKLMEVAGKERHSRDSQKFFKANINSDVCHHCHNIVEDECINYAEFRWHLPCLMCRRCQRPLQHDLANATFSSTHNYAICTACSQRPANSYPFHYITRLSQFAFLLRLALSRLCNLMQVDDQQLSNVANSNKIKSNIRDAVAPREDEVLDKQMQVTSGTMEYPIHITDVKQTVKLDRKMSRSFKSAKRNTILGNVNQLSSQPLDDLDEEEDDDTARPTLLNRQAPTRLDSLIRHVDSRKDAKSLPDLPASNDRPPSQQPLHQQPSTTPTKKINNRVSVGLDDIPLVHKQYIKQPLADPNSPFVPGTGMVSKCTVSATTGKPRVFLSELSALQHMIMRHVAVVQLEPYVSEFFTQAELLQLIQLKKASIWGKFFTPFKKPTGHRKFKEDGTFGVPLEVLTEKTGVESNLGAGASPIRIAGFVDDAITAMRQKDMSVEGIFRKNGNIRRLKQVSEQLDKNPTDVDLYGENGVQIAALLKKWLRELPDPLLTYRLHKLFICAQRLPDAEAQKRVLHLACCMMPRCNRDTMEVLFLFFRWVALFSHVTTDVGSRMDIPNLARVIAPNVLCSTSKDPVKDESMLAIKTVQMLLDSYEEFSLVPEDLEVFLQDSQLQEHKGDMTSKDFLKKVEMMMKKKASNPALNTNPAKQDLHIHTTPMDQHQYHQTQQVPRQAPPPPVAQLPSTSMYQHHPANPSTTSIYAQQQYLPYSNHHPSSDYNSAQHATTRHSSLSSAALNNGMLPSPTSQSQQPLYHVSGSAHALSHNDAASIRSTSMYP